MSISVDREKIVLRKHVSRIVIPSEAEGSFRWRQEGECLAVRNGKHRIAGKAGTVLPVNGLAKESWEKGDEKDFSLRSK